MAASRKGGDSPRRGAGRCGGLTENGSRFRDSGPDGHEEILEVPFAGGLPSPLHTLRFNSVNNPFDISADGDLLATTNCVDVSSEIWLLEPAREEPRLIRISCSPCSSGTNRPMCE